MKLFYSYVCLKSFKIQRFKIPNSQKAKQSWNMKLELKIDVVKYGTWKCYVSLIIWNANFKMRALYWQKKTSVNFAEKQKMYVVKQKKRFVNTKNNRYLWTEVSMIMNKQAYPMKQNLHPPRNGIQCRSLIKKGSILSESKATTFSAVALCVLLSTSFRSENSKRI